MEDSSSMLRLNFAVMYTVYDNWSTKGDNHDEKVVIIKPAVSPGEQEGFLPMPLQQNVYAKQRKRVCEAD
jgi:hypothetical protein